MEDSIHELLQYPKEEIKLRILEFAGKEFLSRGYRNSSLRKIASNAGITTGGIYTYFENKEEIFSCIVKDAVKRWKSRPSLYLALAGIEEKKFFSPDGKHLPLRSSNFQQLVRFIDDFRDEMKLLLLNSEGTAYENFRDTLLVDSLGFAEKFLLRFPIKIRNPEFKDSDFLLKQIIRLNLGIITEMLMKDYHVDDVLRYEKTITLFFSKGWKAVLSDPSV